jgi:hypothetical protein
MRIGRRLQQCVQALACTMLVAASAEAQRAARPTLEPLRVTGEVVVGSYAGIGGYFLGSALGHHIAERWPDGSATTNDFITSGFAYSGAAFATAGGVYMVGASGNQRGSFSATMLGTGVGAGLAWVLDQTFFSNDGNDSADASRTRWTQALVKSLLPSIGATVGFNSSRRF